MCYGNEQQKRIENQEAIKNFKENLNIIETKFRNINQKGEKPN